MNHASSISDIMTGPKIGAGSSVDILALHLDRFQGVASGQVIGSPGENEPDARLLGLTCPFIAPPASVKMQDTIVGIWHPLLAIRITL